MSRLLCYAAAFISILASGICTTLHEEGFYILFGLVTAFLGAMGLCLLIKDANNIIEGRDKK